MKIRLNFADNRIAFFLFLAAFTWRAPYLILGESPIADEWITSVGVFQMLREHVIPIFIPHQTYMAPIHSVFAAVLFKLFGPSLWALRLPAIAFYSLSVPVVYLCLRKVFAKDIALSAALLLSFVNSASMSYTTYIPPYGAGIFLVSLILAATIYIDKHRSGRSWLLFGFLCGFSYYAFPIAIIQVLVSSVWLWRRPVTSKKFLACVIATACLLSPVLYRFLTRRHIYSPTPVDIFLMAAAGISALMAAAIHQRAFRFTGRQAVSAFGYIAAFLATSALPGLYFNYFEKPRLISAGVTPREMAYALKHAHEWIFNIKLFLERTFPTLILGNANEAVGGNIMSVTLGWKSALSVIILIPVITWMLWRVYINLRSADNENYETPIYAPFLLCLGILLPSWRLHNDFCYRVLLPYMFGFIAAFLTLVSAFLKGRKAVLFIFIITYIIYCGFDMWANMRKTDIGEGEEALVGYLKSENIDGVVAPKYTVFRLQWISRDGFNFLDSSVPQEGAFYDADKFFKAAKKIATVSVDEKRWMELAGSRGRNFKKIKDLNGNARIYEYVQN